MEAALDNRPLCKCHSEPMLWNKDAQKRAGGKWYCRVKKRARDARFDASGKGRARHARYKASDKGRARDARYYHAPYGGWLKDRKRDLAAQRAHILDQLEQLSRERSDAAC